jgi:hypothetical protein
MTRPLQDVCCASLPRQALAALVAVRDLPGVCVAMCGDQVVVRWEPGEERALDAVLPVAGVELYVQRDGLWYRYGQHLPAFDFPAQADYRPLHQVVTPAPACPVTTGLPSLQPVALTLVTDPRPRPATALRCGLTELARWADTVPAGRLAALQAARCEGRVLLVGTRLPPLLGGERFWGTVVLVPLGRRPDPDLPASAIRAALGVDEADLLLLTTDGAEVIPTSAFQTLARAQLRQAIL